jgi:hypothetical protein
MDPSPTKKGISPPLSHPEIAKEGKCLKTLETPKGETAKGAQEGYVDSPKNVRCWMQAGRSGG